MLHKIFLLSVLVSMPVWGMDAFMKGFKAGLKVGIGLDLSEANSKNKASNAPSKQGAGKKDVVPQALEDNSTSLTTHVERDKDGHRVVKFDFHFSPEEQEESQRRIAEEELFAPILPKGK